jgi:hypothetical protein
MKAERKKGLQWGTMCKKEATRMRKSYYGEESAWGNIKWRERIGGGELARWRAAPAHFL